MKAAVLRGVDDLRLEDVSDPRPGRDEVLIRINACGVCGTDVHMWEGKNNEGTFPFIPGHEWSGEVVEAGKDTEELGASVVIDPTRGDVVHQIMEHTDQQGASLILECSGTDQALAATMDIVAKHGRVCLIGHSIGRKVPIEIGKLIWQGATVVGSPGAPFYFPKTLSFMSQHLVDLTQVISHRFSLDKVTEAFELGKRTADSMKILLAP